MGSRDSLQQNSVEGGDLNSGISRKMLFNVALAVLAGLALRIFFVLKFPVTDSGDAPFYIELAWNWLKNRVYGFPVHGVLTAVDMRTPGYPAFLAAIFAFEGNSPRAAMLAQAVLDVVTCGVIALIAARLAPREYKQRAGIAALWLAALCPFTANYTAVVLTETLTIFLTAVAILVLLQTQIGPGGGNAFVRDGFFGDPWFLAGLVVGLGTLVRPETPLILFAAGLVLLGKWWRPRDWRKLVRAGVLMGVGLVLPLLPWAARNWRAFHEVRFLAPRYSELPGEYTPHGFIDWTNTWLWRFRDVYLTHWKLNEEEISPDDLPPYAFDSPEERQRVSDLLDQYNETLTIDPTLDAQFREIARERTARHPLRTYVKVPFLRCFALWFTPRVELLPISGHLTPLSMEWEDDRPDFLRAVAFTLGNCFFIGLGLVGAWASRRRPGVAFLIVFIVVRTVFFAYEVETTEPRYVLECFPAVIALGAQALAYGFSSLRRARGEWSPEKSAESVL
jgi:Dolichyl-phosphate-mannose-protein mannosyltransferase